MTAFWSSKEVMCLIERGDYEQTKNKCEKTGGAYHNNQDVIDFSDEWPEITVDLSMIDDIKDFSKKIADQVKEKGYEHGLTGFIGKDVFQIRVPKSLADYIKSINPEIREISYKQPWTLKILDCTCPNGLTWDCDRGCVRMNPKTCIRGSGRWMWMKWQCGCGNGGEFVNSLGRCMGHI